MAVQPDASADHRALARAREPLSASARSWALFQGGRDPWLILIGIYIFIPWFATEFVGDPVRGQALVARAATAVGWVVALTVPLIGLILDRTGRRKPWLLLAAGLMVPTVAALWWARPDGGGLSVEGVLGLHVAASILFGWSDVVFNAMLMPAAGHAQAHRASGLALALANGVSLLLLVTVLALFILPGQVPGLPSSPLFGLDPARGEPQRAVAWLVAGSITLGLIPLLLFTRDAPATGVRLGAAVRGSLRDLRALLARVSTRRDAAVFLGSRMLFADGLLAIFTFSGIYAAGVLGWGAGELVAMGLLFSLFAAGGGLLAARLDGRLGPRRALGWEVALALAALLFLVGLAPGEVLYLPYAGGPVWDGPVFTTLPELLYLASGSLISVGIASSIASSRTLMTRLVPEDELGAWFGLYGLSGTATAWLGPLLVGWATAAFGSQRAGFAPVVLLLLAGLVGLRFVRGGGPLPEENAPYDQAPGRTIAADYERDGFAVAERLFPADEVAALNAEAAAICRGGRGRVHGLSGEDPAGLSDEAVMARYLAVHFPHKISDAVLDTLRDPKLTELLTAFIGPDVKAMQSMLFVKAAGKPGQPWHQDEHFIATRDRSLVGAWIALDDATVENGCLWVHPGSHRAGVLHPMAPCDDPRFDHNDEAQDFPLRARGWRGGGGAGGQRRVLQRLPAAPIAAEHARDRLPPRAGQPLYERPLAAPLGVRRQASRGLARHRDGGGRRPLRVEGHGEPDRTLRAGGEPRRTREPARRPPEGDRPVSIRLPQDFVIGTSTASYQIEGAWDADGKGESIWDRFSHTPGAIKTGDTGDVACDHYNRWAEDLDLMAAAGLDAYRFSLSWTRLFPGGTGARNEAGFDFYDRLVDGCLQRGIEPWPCFYHWDLPQALQDRGGWADRDTAEAYADYAAAAAERLRDRAAKFVLFNEPGVFVGMGHLYGRHAPGLTDRDAYAAATHHVNLATAFGAERVRAAAPGVPVGTTLAWAVFEPADPDSEVDQRAAARAHEHNNLAYADPLFGRGYPPSVGRTVEPYLLDGDLERLPTTLDFLGINHYSRIWMTVDADGRPTTTREPETLPTTQMGWEICPDGMARVLREVGDRYPVPLYVTENGMAAPDDRRGPDGRVEDGDRIRFIHDYLAAALSAGVDLRGYLVWTFLDNFEWAEGNAMRFGIVETDYATLERRPKASYDWYAELARTKVLEMPQ